MRDSGSTLCIISRRLVDKNQYTGRYLSILLMDGSSLKVPEATVMCETPYLSGMVKAAVVKSPLFDFIIGNVEGATIPAGPTRDSACQTERQVDSDRPTNLNETGPSKQVGAAVTRAMARKAHRPERPLKVMDVKDLLQCQDISQEQRSDPSLTKLWKHAEDGTIFGSGTTTHKYVVVRTRLYKECLSDGETKRLLVVPQRYREAVFKLGHEAAMSGHLGRQKTVDRIRAYFTWPSMGTEIERGCRSCDICQRTSDRGRVRPAPLQPLPIISEPFSRVAVDIVGPIHPSAKDGSRYILTLVDFATRWPEAVPLKKIETVTVAEALLQIFTRMGVPEEVLSDNGSQFTSEMMAEVYRLMSIKPLFTTPYHPQGNGLCEKMNGTLKKMLKRAAAEQPREWPRYIAPLLFAYREAPQASLKLSPFELMFGRAVRGPLTVLRDIWDGGNPTAEVRTTYQYVLDLEQRLQATCQLAKTELLKAQALDCKYYDAKAKKRRFQVGDKCLVLLPTSTNKLLAQWTGPYEVVEVCSPLTYKLDVKGVAKRMHINMLKPYYSAPNQSAVAVAGWEPASAEKEGLLSIVRNLFRSNNPHTFVCSTVVIENEEPGQPLIAETSRSETCLDVAISSEINADQKQQLVEVLTEFETTFSDVPGRADVEPYSINLLDQTPVRVRPYPIPFKLHGKVMEELREMEAAGFIEPSTSSYCSPMVVVQRGDKIRICGDFRRLNSVVQFEAEPMASQEGIFAKLAQSKYFSKMDLAKGFFQVPLDPQSRTCTAFATPAGLKQYRVVPFGLSTSPAVFNRTIRGVLGDIEGVEIFVDDILVHSPTWEEHINTLRLVLTKLSEKGFTIKPSKCEMGQSSVDFLGHVVGNGRKSCQEDKVEKVKNALPPETKKQVRAFLGLCGYYRDFIPHFAKIAGPLYDLIKKDTPKRVKWGEAQQEAFEALKEKLCSRPILRLPDESKPYVLRTDASNEGLGAVLLQEFEDGKWPVAYFSRSLKPAERNYATVEKELLAIVVAIKRFYQHLYGCEFILETDHLPLQYLHASRSTTNARLMRWALYLQQYRFRVRYLKGSLNVGADYMSRSQCK